jgi:hypothetical protein
VSARLQGLSCLYTGADPFKGGEQNIRVQLTCSVLAGLSGKRFLRLKKVSPFVVSMQSIHTHVHFFLTRCILFLE